MKHNVINIYQRTEDDKNNNIEVRNIHTNIMSNDGSRSNQERSSVTLNIIQKNDSNYQHNSSVNTVMVKDSVFVDHNAPLRRRPSNSLTQTS